MDCRSIIPKKSEEKNKLCGIGSLIFSMFC